MGQAKFGSGGVSRLAQLGDKRGHLDSGSLGNNVIESVRKRRCIIRKDLCAVRSAGDRDIGEAVIYQLRVNLRVDVNQHALGSKSLGTATGDGIAVIEVAVLPSIGVNQPIDVEPSPNAPSLAHWALSRQDRDWRSWPSSAPLSIVRFCANADRVRGEITVGSSLRRPKDPGKPPETTNIE